MTIDTLYRNGIVLTVDAGHRRATALAVRGDRIAAVGTDAELTALADAGTRTVDLRGRTVVPGFVDPHPHTVHRGTGTLARPSIAGAQSVAEIVERVAGHAAGCAPGEWIVTGPLGEPPDHSGVPEAYAERRWPTRHDLDAVTPRNPVLIPTTPYWPNPAVLNGAALAELGVTASTPDEPGARLQRDPDGTPTGVVHGLTIYQMGARLMQALLPHLPRPSTTDVADAVAQACRQNVALGITTVYEGHGTFTAEPLRLLLDAGRLPHRVVCAYEIPARAPLDALAAWFTEHADAAGTGTGDDMLRVRGATISLDGPPQFGLSHMDHDYLGPDGHLGNGTSSVTAEQLADVARLAVAHDHRLNVMAAGSGACALTVDALAAVHAETPLAGRDWVLQHFFHPPADRLAEIAAMGLSVQTITSVDHSRGEEVYVRRMGDESWRATAPLRRWLDAGVPTSVGSDGSHYDPLFLLRATLERTDGRTGASLLTPAKTVSADEALATQTIGAAVVAGVADRVGSLEPGKLADLAVLDSDVTRGPVEQITDATVLATVIGGTVRHDPHRVLDGH